MGISGTEPACYQLGSSRRWTAGITFVALVIGLGLGLGLFYSNKGFQHPCEADECARAYYGNGCVNASGATGVWLLIFVLPAGIYGVGWLVGELGLLAALSQKVVPKVGLVVLTAVLAGSAAAIFVKVAQPATIWLSTNDPFTAMAGSGLSVLLLLLAVAAFCVTRAAIFAGRGAVSTRVSAINAHGAADSSPLLPPATGVAAAAVTAALPDLYPAGARRNLPLVAVLMVPLALGALIFDPGFLFPPQRFTCDLTRPRAKMCAPRRARPCRHAHRCAD